MLMAAGLKNSDRGALFLQMGSCASAFDGMVLDAIDPQGRSADAVVFSHAQSCVVVPSARQPFGPSDAAAGAPSAPPLSILHPPDAAVFVPIPLAPPSAPPLSIPPPRDAAVFVPMPLDPPSVPCRQPAVFVPLPIHAHLPGSVSAVTAGPDGIPPGVGPDGIPLGGAHAHEVHTKELKRDLHTEQSAPAAMAIAVPAHLSRFAPGAVAAARSVGVVLPESATQDGAPLTGGVTVPVPPRTPVEKALVDGKYRATGFSVRPRASVRSNVHA